MIDNDAKVNGARPIILDACYETDGATNADLPMDSVFGAASATHEGYAGTGAAGSSNYTGVKFTSTGVTVTGDVEMVGYTGTYAAADASAGCDSTMTAVAGITAGNGDDGWQCAGSAGADGTSALTLGIAAAANAASACKTDVNFVTVGTQIGHTGGTLTYATLENTPGRDTDFWPVAPSEFAAIPLANSEAGAAAALCYSHVFVDGATAPAGSWQLTCDLETGNIDRTDDADDVFCDWGGATTAPFKRGSSNTSVIGEPGMIATASVANTQSYKILNSAAEWDTICAIPAHTATAKYFNGYLAAGTCATHTDALGAEANTVTRSIIMDVCYTLDATGNDMAGWGLPFAAGTASTIPVAGKRSVKFVETGTGATAEIQMWHYGEHDCSGTASKTISDDPADAWCQNSSKISHGGVGTSGNAATQLQTATNYITVRQHVDDTGVNASDTLGMPGACLGVADQTSGYVLDHFVVHTGKGDSPATGCHQTAASSTNTAADGDSYAWWCDTTDYSINYGEFDDNKCETMKAGSQLKFSKLAYDTCTEADATDSNTDCTFPQTSSTETPSAFDYGTINALVNGAAADYGGKCLVKAADISWEILTDNDTWDAICGASGSTPTDADSAAGKIAATVAAGAAAAAALLI